MQFFERHEFLEFFDEEKILDEELGWYNYSVRLEQNLLLEVSFMVAESTFSLTLKHQNSERQIIGISFNRYSVDRLTLEKSKNFTVLFLYKIDFDVYPYRDKGTRVPDYSFVIKPSFSMDLNL